MTDYKAGQRRFNTWLRENGLSLARVEDHGLQRDDDGWDHFAWTLHVKHAGNPDVYAFPYRAGLAHRGKPTLVDVMAALFSDANCVDGRTFDEFCEELGYDSEQTVDATWKGILSLLQASPYAGGHDDAWYADNEYVLRLAYKLLSGQRAEFGWADYEVIEK